jgi:hypothetical protein
MRNTGSRSSGLYYKPMMIVNDDSRVATNLETSLTDDARVIIYDRHMFIVQASNNTSKLKLVHLFIGAFYDMIQEN